MPILIIIPPEEKFVGEYRVPADDIFFEPVGGVLGSPRGSLSGERPWD
jgi:hypothetical protein